MKLSQAYPSKYLKSDDLNGQDVTVTISGVELESFDDDTGGRAGKKEQKLILAFRGKEKKLVCNKTNANTIAKLLGSDDTDDWIGKAVVIGPREVEFGGELVWAIRVSLKAPGTAKPATAPVMAAQQVPMPEGSVPVDDGSEVPF